MNYKNELDFAVDLAKQAGEIMRRYFRANDNKAEWKEDDTPLTLADTTINDLVIERVKAKYPHYSVLGEESSFDANGDFVWVVDPVDGTSPFMLGIPVSTFSLALVDKKDGQPIVGVVYDPQLNNFFTATKDGGAYLNDKKLKVSNTKMLNRTYVEICGGNISEDELSFLPGKCIDIVRIQGAKLLDLQSHAYCGTRVATGELAGTVFGFGAPWDVAATSLLVQEAGGISTDIRGNIRRYDEFANGSIHAPNEEILSILVNAINISKS